MNDKNHDKKSGNKIISLKDKSNLLGHQGKTHPTPNLGHPITHLRQWASKKKKNVGINDNRTNFWHIIQLLVLLGLTAALMKTCRG